MNGTRPVQLQIDRIVIDGVPLTRIEAGQLRGALETELARLLTSARPDWRGGAVRALAAPPVYLTTSVHPVALGQAIARSVHASLTQDT